MKALVAEMNGEVVGVIGVVRDKQYGRFFFDGKEILKDHLRSITLMRGLKRAMKFVTEYNGLVISVAQHHEGARLLKRLGFRLIDGDVYLWPN